MIYINRRQQKAKITDFRLKQNKSIPFHWQIKRTDFVGWNVIIIGLLLLHPQ